MPPLFGNRPLPRDKEVRVKGNANLLAAARAANCGCYVLQSSAFWYAPGPGIPAQATGVAQRRRGVKCADVNAAILSETRVDADRNGLNIDLMATAAHGHTDGDAALLLMHIAGVLGVDSVATQEG
jgi:hypothetical protein